MKKIGKIELIRDDKSYSEILPKIEIGTEISRVLNCDLPALGQKLHYLTCLQYKTIIIDFRLLDRTFTVE